MINNLIQASNDYISLLNDIEQNDGVLTEELEARWDFIVSEMATVSDQLANTLDYIDTAIEVVKKKKDRYYSKQKQLEGFKSRLRDTAKSLMLNGVSFESEDRSVSLSKPKSRWNVDNVDTNTVGHRFIRVEVKLEKQALINSIESGEIEPPEGAVLKTNQSLVVR